MSTIVVQQNIQKAQMFFPSPKTGSQVLLSSTNSWLIPEIRSTELVKEQLKRQVGQVHGDIIYCEGETSTNLSTGVANGDYVFRHPEADTMLLSAKVRASKYTGPVVLDCGDTDVYVQAAYVSQQVRGDLLIKQLLCYTLGRG